MNETKPEQPRNGGKIYDNYKFYYNLPLILLDWAFLDTKHIQGNIKKEESKQISKGSYGK